MASSHSPPRLWWLKRLAALLVVVLVGLMLFHMWLTRHVDRRMERIVEGWRSEPGAILPEHAKAYTGIAVGADNAAFHYRRAVAALPPLTQAQRDNWDLRTHSQFELPADVVATLRQIVAQDAPALALAREARAFDRADWGAPALSAGMTTDWTQMRQLATHLWDAATLAHHDGDIATAVGFLRDVNHLADRMGNNGPSLVSGLVTAGIYAGANGRFREFAWHSPPGLSEAEERAAWQSADAEVRAAIAELLDETAARQTAVLAVRGERVNLHSMLGALGAGLGVPLPANALTYPTLRADAARTLEAMDRLVAIAEADDIVSMLAITADHPGSADTLAKAMSGWVHTSTLPSHDRGIAYLYQTRAERQMTAALLAAKLFHLDHGRWPSTLEEMVPAYLPRLPIDPFSADDRPIGFRADTPIPIVSSVGEDGIDDHGSTAQGREVGRSARARYQQFASPWGRMDLVYPLHLPPEYFQYPADFNVWHYLQDPAAEIERASAEAAQRKADERAGAQ